MGISLYLVIFRLNYTSVTQLAVAYSLLIIPLFLSYRLVLEQWFIWLLPLLLILRHDKILGKMEFWGTTIIALLYSHKNFPHYLLPSYPLLGEHLNALAQLPKMFTRRDSSLDWTILYPPPPGNFEALLPNAAGGIILSILGVGFSLILAIIFVKLIRYSKRKQGVVPE
jgi:hypothetical protein